MGDECPIQKDSKKIWEPRFGAIDALHFKADMLSIYNCNSWITRSAALSYSKC